MSEAERAEQDAHIRARIEGAADTMPETPVRWGRVAALARRKALLGAFAALAIGAVVAVLLLYGGAVGRLALHPGEGLAIPVPFVGVSVPDVAGMTEAEAIAELKREGLKGVTVDRCPQGRRCLVRGTRPEGGSHVLSGAVVKLDLGPKPPVIAVVTGQGGSITTSTGSQRTSGSHGEASGVASIESSLSESEVVANGSSETLLTAKAFNGRAQPVAGQKIEFLPMEAGVKVGAVSEHPSGVYTATIVSSIHAGTVMIVVQDHGHNKIHSHAVLTEIPGPAAHISLSLERPEIVADGRSTTTVEAKVTDENKNSVGHQSVRFESKPGGLVGEEVVEKETGVYTATITSSKRPGIVVVIAKDESAKEGSVTGETILKENLAHEATENGGEETESAAAG